MTWAALGTNASRFFVVLPLVLTRFGDAEVAVWYLMGTFMQVQAMMDLGFGATASRFFSYAMGGAPSLDDPRGGTGQPNLGLMARLYGTMRLAMAALAAVALLAAGAVGTLLLMAPVGDTPDPAAAWAAWAVLLAGSTIGFFGLLYGSCLQGTGHVALVRRWEAVTNVGAITTTVAVLASGGGLVAFALVGQAWTLVAVLRNRHLARRYVPAARAARAPLDRALLATLWSRAWRTGVGLLANAATVRLSLGLLPLFLAPSDLAAFLVAFTILDRLNQVAQAPFYSHLPQLAVHYSAGRWREMQAQARRRLALSLAIFVVGAAIAGLAAGPLLAWIGSDTPFIGLGVWATLAAALALHRCGAMLLQVYTLSNHVVWHLLDGGAGLLFVGAFGGLLALAPAHAVFALPLAMLAAYGLFYAPASFAYYWRWAKEHGGAAQ